VRLTLRTLLAYLDDTLDPGQTKLIGQKVAESDTAQELVARIKQVTRRRRLTTPAETGPGGKIDPNTIAEYLDNAVSAEQQADIEQICLASDVHLAEVAACHQILTLVLGEPALVPPPAKQRMYGLVKGPEAIPFRKPPVRVHREHELVEESRETDETLRLGLPAYRRKGGWSQRLLLLGGGVAVAALLVFAIMQVMNPPGPGKGERPTQVASTNGNKEKEKPEAQGEKEKKEPEPPKDKTEKKDKEEKKTKPEQPVEKGGGKEVVEKKPLEPALSPIPYEKPSTRPVHVGDYLPSSSEISILLQSKTGQNDWHRIGLTKPQVSSARPLVSLPGSRSIVQTKNGVRLTLWGWLPELTSVPPVRESEVELHYSEQPEIDLDLTLLRGRIVLLNGRDGPARVRLRFENPTDPDPSRDFFDLAFQEKGAEILIDRFGLFDPSEPFIRDPKSSKRGGPTAIMWLLSMAGDIYLKFNDLSVRLDSRPGPTFLMWNSKSGLGNANRLDKVPDTISTNPPLPEKISEEQRKAALRARSDMLKARDELGTDLSVREIDVVLKEAVTSKDPAKRILAVRSFGALDDLPSLVDALDQDNYRDVRLEAIQTLLMWIATSRNAEYKVYDIFKSKYNLPQAFTLMELLHGTWYSPEARAQPETYDTLITNLDNDILPIRQLSNLHLHSLSPGPNIPDSTTQPREIRRKIQDDWRKIIPPGKVPAGMTK
jgi:hypothetical protein